MKRIKLYFVLLLCFLYTGVNAQLANFSLEITKTNETCRGNGSLTFSVSNTTPNAAILYKVFKMPNASSPLTIQENNYFTGLVAGTYKVVAIQSFGSLLNTQEKQVVIENNITPLTFSISSLNRNCTSGGAIVLSASSGTIAECEILSGPVRRSRQTDLTFDNLPSGIYNVRAFNECGIGKVKTFALSVVNATLNISDPEFNDAGMPCDSIMVSNKITPSAGAINYPLAVRQRIYPMDMSGNDIVVDYVFQTGNPDLQVITTRMPRHLTQSYTYDIEVIDYCGNPYQKNDNVVDPSISLKLSTGEAPCAEKYLILNASMFKGSYTVNFLNAPADFNPADYNATPQGPFTTATVNFGGVNNSVPFGTYEVEITDSCGRTVKESILIEFKKPVPSVGGSNNGCFSLFGSISILSPPQKIVSATLLSAPSDYTTVFPKDLTANINALGQVKMYNIPLGDYTITFTDDCGFVYTKTIKVPPYTPKTFDITTLPSCGPDMGAVRYRSGNGDIANVKITEAPASFGQSLPYDVTSRLNADGDLYMTNLPAGTYKFSGLDVCGVAEENTIVVNGYNAPVNPFVFTPNCGTFSVKVDDKSNGTEGATYWLQKYFPATNSWGHPQTGGLYHEGDVPTATNGIRLYNAATRNNNNFSGDFRIVKKFETFTEGSSQNSVCVSVFDKFHFAESLSITAAYTLACTGAPNDIVLEYEGIPTAFKIIKKNGQDFTLDNGASNVFHNLEPAEYIFQMEDGCYNVITQMFNVVNLPSIGAAQAPGDMIQCADKGEVANQVYRLSDQNATILGPLYSSMYTITYYTSQIDAEAGNNALPDYYNSRSNGEQIFARLENNQIPICHAITSFKLLVGVNQEPEIKTYGTICNQGKLSLTAAPGYDAYIWSTGETTRTIYVTEPGNYKVEVRKFYGNTYCPGYSEVEVEESFTPEITKIQVDDWTRDENMITIYTTEGDREYSIDGMNYQESNVFTGLEPGVYNVHVKDANGCGEITQEVVLLNYPNYFTPNGDGEHDKWHISYSFKEPNFKVSIFDRYGKLITMLQANSDGWDGTLNGIQLPSTDYWFVATREDGRELRGHFSMLR
ncbi:T9SS type B sorting domain-containing protein [Flavobacterium psychrotrophum]|uniref:T9SS type B sorting domain-containing protein n=1 Tax=Flavobacterium psychrotrophum TaxID=2294119 RepID=UPI0013C4828C|nr:T9SS type B sorting domain-containing protein [Flavobacterium psychrotrophum]